MVMQATTLNGSHVYSIIKQMGHDAEGIERYGAD